MRKTYLTILGACLVICVCTNAAARNRLNVTLNGLSGPSLQNSKTSIELKLKALNDNPTPQEIKHLYYGLYHDITEAIKPYGYFEARIATRLLQMNSHTWHAIINVQPGEAIKVNRVHIEILGAGKQDPTIQALVRGFPLHHGDILYSDKFTQFKQQLLNLANQRGYFDAQAKTTHIRINLHTYRANIIIIFDTGRRYRFGTTTFKQNYFSQSFLRRFITYKKSDYYDVSSVTSMQQNLLNTNYFSDVSVSPDLSKIHSSNSSVPVTANFKLNQAYRYRLGAGYGTDTGVRGLLGLRITRLNRYGHYFDSFIRGSQVGSTLTADYYIPGSNPVNDRYEVSVSAGSIHSARIGNSKNFRSSASYSTVLWGVKQTISLTYLNEYYNLNGTTLKTPKINTNIVMPGIEWDTTVTDNVLQPEHGYSVSLKIFGTSQQFGSNTTFTQTSFSARWLDTFSKNYRLLLRGNLARTIIPNLSSLPLSLQLYAGGANSIRGYSYQQIGPGRNLYVGSVELQRRIVGNFYLAGFYDLGNVTNYLAIRNTKRGAGGGLVWLSPVGALKLTVARALDAPRHPWAVQFSMGPEL